MKELVDIATIIYCVAASTGVVFIARQTKIFKRGSQYQALHNVLIVQNDERFIKQLRLLYESKELHDARSITDIEALSPQVWQAVEEVTNKMDDVGYLIRSGVLFRSDFLNKFFERILCCNKACSGYIDIIQRHRHQKLYQENFLFLAKIADRYNKKRGVGFVPDLKSCQVNQKVSTAHNKQNNDTQNLTIYKKQNVSHWMFNGFALENENL